MNKRALITTLEVLYWGVALGGEHYTGTLKGYTDMGFKSYKVEHKLSQKEATYLNKKDCTNSRFFVYRKGQLSDRFETLDQLEREAVKIYKKEFPFSIVLVLKRGSVSVCSPEKILDGPEPFKTDVNDMVDLLDDAYKSLPNKEYEKLSDKFNNLCENLLNDLIQKNL